MKPTNPSEALGPGVVIPIQGRPIVWLLAAWLIYIIARLPPVFHAAGAMDEQFFSIPGYTVATEGIPRIPFLPAKKRETFFEGADVCLFASPRASLLPSSVLLVHATDQRGGADAGVPEWLLCYSVGLVVGSTSRNTGLDLRDRLYLVRCLAPFDVHRDDRSPRSSMYRLRLDRSLVVMALAEFPEVEHAHSGRRALWTRTTFPSLCDGLLPSSWLLDLGKKWIDRSTHPTRLGTYLHLHRRIRSLAAVDSQLSGTIPKPVLQQRTGAFRSWDPRTYALSLALFSIPLGKAVGV